MVRVRAHEGLNKVGQWGQLGAVEDVHIDHFLSTHHTLAQDQKNNEEEKHYSLTNKGVGGPGTAY